jgi:acyl-CoA synthetase (AMP-forming)/AMP-acid ligase II
VELADDIIDECFGAGLAVHPCDPRVPAREVCVVRYLLDRWAAERGGDTYVIFDANARYTYRQMRERVISVAVGLARLGVKQGDHVLAWQPTSPEMLATYYAINYLGAVFVPINTAYRGVCSSMSSRIPMRGSRSCTRADRAARGDSSGRACAGGGHGTRAAVASPAADDALRGVDRDRGGFAGA